MTVLHPWPCLVDSAPHADVDSAPSHFSLGRSPLRKVRPALARHTMALRAGAAELLLLQRLRARTRRELSQETLEQAARILEVTARQWLSEEPGEPPPA